MRHVKLMEYLPAAGSPPGVQSQDEVHHGRVREQNQWQLPANLYQFAQHIF